MLIENTGFDAKEKEEIISENEATLLNLIAETIVELILKEEE